MKHTQILKHAWNILWEYKALWLFGVILALTSGGGFSGGGNQISYRQSMERSFEFPRGEWFGGDWGEMGRWFSHVFPLYFEQSVLWIVLALIVVLLLITVLFTIGRYVSQVALIRMVDGYEASHEKVNWRAGFRLGWSRSAWRLFLINLIIYLPLTLIIAFLIAAALVPVIVSSMRSGEPSALGIVATIGIVLLVILVAVVIGVVLGLVIEMISRVCVLQGTGVIDSIRQGWRLVRRHFGDVGLMWLILLGVRVGYAILMIPVVLLLGGLALLFGGGVGAIVHFAVNAIQSAPAAWVPAMIVGGLLFLFLLALPFLFLAGLRETYLSTSWTLAYRQLIPSGEIAAPLIETSEASAGA
ncbi:MAG: hypothetical protein PHD58_04435 [Anaerolineales bacterium]|nr:hypothetical protein [Anaerolineales bacterium]